MRIIKSKLNPLFVLSLTIILQIESTAQTIHEVNLSANQPSQLQVNAGNDITAFTSFDVMIGGTPAVTGGTSPYNYNWTPATNLSDPLIANPSLNVIDCEPTYTLTVTDSKGCTASDVMSVTIVITSIEGNAESIFSVFPNPTSSQLTFQSEHISGQLILSDIAGKVLVVQQISNGQFLIDVKKLIPGTYILHYQSGKKKQSSKIIVH